MNIQSGLQNCWYQFVSSQPSFFPILLSASPLEKAVFFRDSFISYGRTYMNYNCNLQDIVTLRVHCPLSSAAIAATFMVKKQIWSRQNFRLTKFWWSKRYFSVEKKFGGRKNFLVEKNFLGGKKVLVKKLFLVKKKILVKKIFLVEKKSWSMKIFFGQ